MSHPKGKAGRGTMEKERLPVFGMMQRGGQVVINLLADVQQKTIEPFIKATIVASTFIQTSIACMPICSHGATTIRVSTTDEASSRAMKMATAFVKSMCIRWQGAGRSCAAGFGRIGAFPQRNSRFIWVAPSVCTTSASEAKRCFLRSLRYWSGKILESNMSEVVYFFSGIAGMVCS
jgi:hypothetical protein